MVTICLSALILVILSSNVPVGAKILRQPLGAHLPHGNLQLSFIYCSRNDAYGGASKLRLSASLSVLFWGLKEYGLERFSEVILVDWGSSVPLAQTAEMRHLLEAWPACTKQSVANCRQTIFRVLRISRKAAFSITNHTHVSEVHALNAAARRAEGTMVLHLDQDTLVGIPFFKFLQQQSRTGWSLLRCSWFAGRRMTQHKEVDGILQDAVGFIKSMGPNGTVPLDAPIDAQHGYGPTGIFAVPRLSWEVSRGFNESMTRWGHMHVDYIPRLNRYLHSTVDLSDYMEVRQPFYHIVHAEMIEARGENDLMDQSYPLSMNGWDWGLMNVPMQETVWAPTHPPANYSKATLHAPNEGICFELGLRTLQQQYRRTMVAVACATTLAVTPLAAAIGWVLRGRDLMLQASAA